VHVISFASHETKEKCRSNFDEPKLFNLYICLGELTVVHELYLSLEILNILVIAHEIVLSSGNSGKCKPEFLVE